MGVISTTEQLPGQLDLLIYQGTTFLLNLTWTDSTGSPVNLAGYTADMKLIRSDQSVIQECSTANGMIVLGGPAGTIAVTIPATTVTYAPGSGNYDLLLTSGSGVVYPLVAGAVTIRASVTAG